MTGFQTFDVEMPTLERRCAISALMLMDTRGPVEDLIRQVLKSHGFDFSEGAPTIRQERVEGPDEGLRFSQRKRPARPRVTFGHEPDPMRIGWMKDEARRFGIGEETIRDIFLPDGVDEPEGGAIGVPPSVAHEEELTRPQPTLLGSLAKGLKAWFHQTSALCPCSRCRSARS